MTLASQNGGYLRRYPQPHATAADLVLYAVYLAGETAFFTAVHQSYIRVPQGYIKTLECVGRV